MASRIPTKDNDFNNYINSTTTALSVGTPDTATRLGLTAGEKTEWEGHQSDWATNYALYVNADTRTKTVKDLKNAQKRGFIEFANPLLTRMSVSPNLTASDRNTFNLPERKDAGERPDMGERPFVGLTAKGGGSVVVVVRMQEDGSKASLHPGADHIELRHVLLNVDAPAPTSIRELTEMTISSRGRTELKLGDPAMGHVLYLAARYVNKVDASKNSPYSAIQKQVVA